MSKIALLVSQSKSVAPFRSGKCPTHTQKQDVSKLIEALSFWVIDKGTGFDTQKRAEVSHFRHVLNLSQKRAFLILVSTGYFSRRKAPRFALNWSS
jgi:hypothetical protein